MSTKTKLTDLPARKIESDKATQVKGGKMSESPRTPRSLAPCI